METTKISVVMAVYKEEPNVVKRALDAIANQTFGEYEFIVVLDYPENKAVESYILDRAKSDNRIIFLKNDKNRGQGYSRNRAINHSKSGIIALQDADDGCDPNRLKLQYEFLEQNPEVDVIGTGLIYYDFNEQKELYRRAYPSEIDQEIKRRSPCGHPSMMVRKDVYLNSGMYSTEFVRQNNTQVFVEDYELYIRWYLKGVKIKNLQEFLYLYHRDDKGIEIKAKGMLQSVVGTKKKFRSQLNFGLVDSFYMYLEDFVSRLSPKAINFLFKMTQLKNLG